MPLTVGHKLVNRLQQRLLVKFTGKDALSKVALEENETQLTIRDLLVDAHEIEKSLSIHGRVGRQFRGQVGQFHLCHQTAVRYFENRQRFER